MEERTVLVATDLSELSMAAVDHAARQAQWMDATLLIAHVASVPTSSEGEGMIYHGFGTEDDATVERHLAAVEPDLDGVRVEHRMLRGDPASELVRLATEERVAMIVMSTHGRTGVLRLLLGSVAEAVLRQAPCPVLMVRPPSGNP